MPNTTSSIVSEVQSLTREADKVIVEVDVAGPTRFEGLMEQRARARALIATGLGNAMASGIGNITAGEVDRLTRTVKDEAAPESNLDPVPVMGQLLQARKYTIEVDDSETVRERLMGN